MKKSNKHLSFLQCIFLCCIFCSIFTVLSGCGLQKLSAAPSGKDPAGSTTDPMQTTQPASTTAPIVTLPLIPEFLHPLTGEETSEATAKQRPIAVCIGNTQSSLPQYALSLADILVEVPVESGITRLMLIGTDLRLADKIGSIRSTRDYLADIANCFDAVQVYAGTTDAGTSVSYPDYDTLDYIMQNLTQVFYTDTERVSPHQIMTNGARIQAAMQSMGIRDTNEALVLPYTFTDYRKKPSVAPDAVTYIKIPYSTSQTTEFHFDSETHSYERHQFGAPHTEAGSSTPLSFRNVVLLFCNNITYESSTGTNISLDTQTGGTGYYFADGYCTEITWYRDPNGHLVLENEANQKQAFERGKTYIGFVRVSQKNAIVTE